MEMEVPEVNPNGGKVVLAKLVLSELHEKWTFANSWTANEYEFDKLVVLFYHIRFIVLIIRYEYS